VVSLPLAGGPAAGRNVMPGIPDAGRLARWLAADPAAAALGRALSIELIPGGRSNLTYRMDTESGPVVLRRPPLGRLLPKANDMGREFRVQCALAGSAVPVPVPLTCCADDEVLGAPFYLMEYVDGLVLRTRRDGAVLVGTQAGQLSAQLAAMLSRIHAVDYGAAGLARYGKSEGYLARQLNRWERQWELSATRAIPGYDQLAGRLRAGLPASAGGTLVHGDFRLDNTLVRLRPVPAIMAVIDWELSTLGDPLADLGTLLTYWADPEDPDWARVNFGASVSTLPGFCTAGELAACYGHLSGRDVSGIGWYVAFGCFRLAVVLEGLHARFLRKQTVGDGFEREGPAVPVLVSRAHRLLDRMHV
jgi:aminoglycoside phosphotransferase (APT) family kinase protein